MTLRSVRLQDDIASKLEALATKARRSGNWIINEALRQYLEKNTEPKRQEKDTLEALNDVRNGRVVDAEAVHQWLLSWGSKQELSKPKSKPKRSSRKA